MDNYDEKRKYKRITKPLILSYFDKTSPTQKKEITQVRNISLGGICFVSTVKLIPSTTIGLEIKTPFLADSVYVEGHLLSSNDRVPNMLYENRVEFKSISPESKIVIEKLIHHFELNEGN